MLKILILPPNIFKNGASRFKFRIFGRKFSVRLQFGVGAVCPLLQGQWSEQSCEKLTKSEGHVEMAFFLHARASIA